MGHGFIQIWIALCFAAQFYAINRSLVGPANDLGIAPLREIAKQRV
jgi:hypothetical protein